VGIALFVLALALVAIQFGQALHEADTRDRRLIRSAVGGMLIIALTLALLTRGSYREYLGASVIGLLFGFTIYRELPVIRRSPRRVLST
jgi:hypothetical protein